MMLDWIPNGREFHIHFACGVAVDVELPPIWEAVAQGKEKMEGLATLNQALMRGLHSCCRIFGGRDHFITSLPLLALPGMTGLSEA